MKIFITGCAKSGTTLVRRLFQAYDLKVATEEMTLLDFYFSDYDVAKRTADSILSNELKDRHYADAYFIINQDIKIVNVVRDKASVLGSSKGYVSGVRYNGCMKQLDVFKRIVAYKIWYDYLMINTNYEQTTIAKRLSLKIMHKWSDYPKFIDESKEDTTGGYKLRPIGADYDI